MEEVNTLIDNKLHAATDFAYRCGLAQLNKKKATTSIKVPECCNNIDLANGIFFADIQKSALMISTCYENMTNRHVKTLVKYFGECAVFKCIQCLKDMDDTEKIKQIRNCFAHGHYKISNFNPDSEDYIYIDNGKVCGKIDIDGLTVLCKVFRYMSIVTSPKGIKIIVFGDKLKAINRSVLLKKLDSITYYSIHDCGEGFAEEALDTVIHPEKEFAMKKTKLEKKHLSDKEKRLVLDAFEGINFLNLEKAEKLFPGFINEFLEEVITNIINIDSPHVYSIPLQNLLTPLIFGTNAINIYTMEARRDYTKYTSAAAFTFTKLLLNYSFFTFDYLREMNERNNKGLFLYKDFDMTGINFQTFNGEAPVKQVDPKKKIEDDLKVIRSKIRKLDDILKAKEKRKKDFETAGDKLPDRENKIKKVNEEIEKIKRDLLIEFEKLNDLSGDLLNNSEGPYIDCRNLFRHLRNAVTHYRYSVDYGDAIFRGDYGRIKFHFEDYDDIYDDQNNVVGEKLNFTMDCDARTLERFLKDVNERISNMLETNELKEMFEDEIFLKIH